MKASLQKKTAARKAKRVHSSNEFNQNAECPEALTYGADRQGQTTEGESTQRTLSPFLPSLQPQPLPLFPPRVTADPSLRSRPASNDRLPNRPRRPVFLLPFLCTIIRPIGRRNNWGIKQRNGRLLITTLAKGHKSSSAYLPSGLFVPRWSRVGRGGNS